jgi:hypothetical protein
MQAVPNRLSLRGGVILAVILIGAVVVRLYHINAPIVDQLFTKQVHTANKARHMAGPPWNPNRDTMDFLDEAGQPAHFVEEFPLYCGWVAGCYACLGEAEWLARLCTIACALVVVAGLADLARREFQDEAMGLMAGFIAAFSPLLIYWGRCVSPDVGMLGAMVVAAAAQRRRLDGGGWGWLLLACLAAACCGLFKPYGLMVLIPLCDQILRAHGLRRGLSRWESWAIIAATILPLATWIVLVFLPAPNPITRTQYFLWQVPDSILSPRFYEALFWRLPVKDLGPITAVGLGAGLITLIRGRAQGRPILSWAVMGLAFFVGCAPKLLDHDYYELCLIPAGAMTAALGWRTIGRRLEASRGWSRPRVLAAGACLAVLTVWIQSPLVLKDKFEPEIGHLKVAERIQHYLKPGERAIVAGHPQPWAIMHYAMRECWAIEGPGLPRNWSERVARYRAQGARLLVVYTDPLVPPRDLEQMRVLWDRYPMVESGEGPWFRRGRPARYAIFDIQSGNADGPGDALAAPGTAVQPVAQGVDAAETRVDNVSLSDEKRRSRE